MSITFLALAAASLAAAAPGAAPSAAGTITHSLPIVHQGNSFTATYLARPKVNMREIGISPGARAGTLRCSWTADIAVERSIGSGDGAAANPTVRTLAPVKRIAGSLPGSCAGSRDRVDREIVARADTIARHVELVAREDHRTLLGELENLTGTSVS